MGKSSLSVLPAEVLYLILDELGTKSLLSLSQTCRRLYEITTPLIYRNANVKNGNIDLFLQTIKNSENIATLVREINVTIPASIVKKVSPCEIALVFVLVEELECLTLGGIFGNSELNSLLNRLPQSPSSREIAEGGFWDTLGKMILQPLTDIRIGKNLKSLTLDGTAGAYSASSYLISNMPFLIPQLETLNLCEMSLRDSRMTIPIPWERQTNLRTLSLKRCGVTPFALRAVLHAPRALKFLSLINVSWYDNTLFMDLEEGDIHFRNFLHALIVQRNSLVGIKIEVDGIQFTYNSPEFSFVARRFPKLEEWEGCDIQTLHTFLTYQVYSDTDIESDEFEEEVVDSVIEEEEEEEEEEDSDDDIIDSLIGIDVESD